MKQFKKDPFIRYYFYYNGHLCFMNRYYKENAISDVDVSVHENILKAEHSLLTSGWRTIKDEFYL